MVCFVNISQGLWTLVWIPIDGRSTRIYLHQLCMDTGCGLKDLPRALDDRDGWKARESRKSMLSVWLDDDDDEEEEEEKRGGGGGGGGYRQILYYITINCFVHSVRIKWKPKLSKVYWQCKPYFLTALFLLSSDFQQKKRQVIIWIFSLNVIGWWKNIFIGLVWFRFVLWHINHRWLFNAKSIFINIKSSISNNSV